MQSDYPHIRPPESADDPASPAFPDSEDASDIPLVPEGFGETGSPDISEIAAVPDTPVATERPWVSPSQVLQPPLIEESSKVPEGPKIREVALVSGETVTHVFAPEAGLIPHPPPQGETLVMTNRRVIAFCQNEGARETVLVPMEEIKSVAVVSGRRNASMLVQGGLMVVAGLFIYMVLAYWLAGRFEGPTIPVLNMDLAPVIALLIILSGIALIAQVYFAKPDGTVTFQGDGVKFTFPFRGETAERQAFEVVNTAFALRGSANGLEPELEDRAESS